MAKYPKIPVQEHKVTIRYAFYKFYHIHSDLLYSYF